MARASEGFKELYNAVAKIVREVERCFPKVKFDTIDARMSYGEYSVDLSFEISEDTSSISADASFKKFDRCINRLTKKVCSGLEELLDELEDQLEEYESDVEEHGPNQTYTADPRPLMTSVQMCLETISGMNF